jgi:hypothetical protein
MVEETEKVEEYSNRFKEVFKSQGPFHLFQKYVPSFDISILKSNYFEGNENYYVWSFKMMNLLQKKNF